MIIKGSSSNFTPAPEGVHNAVLVDVIDLGMVEGQYGPRHKVRFVWEIDVLIPQQVCRESKLPDGSKFTVRKQYGASLHEKSQLTKDLATWRGKPMTEEEKKHFDTENLIGVPCRLLVQHSPPKDDTVYANVMAVLKPEKKLAPSGFYKRMKDREPQAAEPPAKQLREDDRFDESQIPF